MSLGNLTKEALVASIAPLGETCALKQLICNTLECGHNHHYAIALCCLVLAALMPMLELVPLVSTLPAAAFTAFGIALLLGDGVAALAGFGFTLITLGLIVGLVRLPF